MTKKRQRQSHESTSKSPGQGDDPSSSTNSWLSASEAEDLKELRRLARTATVVEFDGQGRIARPTYLPQDTFDPIDGLFRIQKIPPVLLQSLTEIHDEITRRVGTSRMVPWAGVGVDSSRLRAFGFPGQHRRDRLNASGIRLYAIEKQTEDEIRQDEQANNVACTVLVDEWKERTELAVQRLLDLLPPASHLCLEDLIALQPNLHNGAQHLAAHVDFPRHEGFGKVICTVAIRGDATILLIGRDIDEETQSQPCWRFRLNQGECYVLSGSARNHILHAVLADNGASDNDGGRESLNLRFGLHTAEEAEADVMEYWVNDT